MRSTALCAAVAVAVVVGLTHASPEARADSGSTRDRDVIALHELLDGDAGRETWTSAPSLVLLTSIMNYADGSLTAGYRATTEQLSDLELSGLAQDFTRALRDLTGGAFKGFRAVTRERVAPGLVASVVRSGRVVAGRFRDLTRVTHNLGYGGRRSHNGVINGGFVLLDADVDRDPAQRNVLRTHELGHALGYHHVEAVPSVMNPHIGHEITEFDRELFLTARR